MENEIISIIIIGCITLILGIRLVYKGVRIYIYNRGRYSSKVKGKVVSSHIKEYKEDTVQYYDIYSTINYKVNGKEYQIVRTYERSKKYYHQLTQGNYITLVHPPEEPENAEILFDLPTFGVKKIKTGLILLGVSLLLVCLCLSSY